MFLTILLWTTYGWRRQPFAPLTHGDRNVTLGLLAEDIASHGFVSPSLGVSFSWF